VVGEMNMTELYIICMCENRIMKPIKNSKRGS
jgi:hypothetical protein